MSRKDIIKLLIAAAVVALAVLLAGRLGRKQEKDEYDIIYNAVRNAALTCYAVEGAYPENVEYLLTYYQLAYDTDRYFVNIVPLGATAIPGIFVTERGAEFN